MPTYEYECTVCGHVFDVFHSMTAKPRIKCTECGGRSKKKIGAGAGIIFKGSGFYETDYKRKSNHRGPGPSGHATSATSTDSKSEQKKSDTTKTD